MEYQKENEQGCTDGNKGQGSFLLLSMTSYYYVICKCCELKSYRVLYAKEVGTTLDLCYHPYNLVRFLFGTPCLLSFSIFCNCFLYL